METTPTFFEDPAGPIALAATLPALFPAAIGLMPAGLATAPAAGGGAGAGRAPFA